MKRELDASKYAPYFFPRTGLEIMLGKSKNIKDGIKFVFASFWVAFCACLGDVRCQEGKKNPFSVDAFGKTNKNDCDVTQNF